MELVASPEPYLSIYPNPVTDKLCVRFAGNGTNENLELQVFSMLGQEMYGQVLEGSVTIQQLIIPVENWTPGVYLVKLSNEQASKVMKIKIESE